MPIIVDTPLPLMLRLRRGICRYLFCQPMLPVHPLCITTTKSQVNSRTCKTTNCWHSVDTDVNVLFIQHLLRSIIVFILIWLNWSTFCLIETPPCGNAERRSDLALFTFTRLKIMYHATWFSEPPIHPFTNRYSQINYHSPPIYLWLKLSVKLHNARESLTHSVQQFILGCISPRFNCIDRH
jgi:hypothetical protein